MMEREIDGHEMDRLQDGGEEHNSDIGLSSTTTLRDDGEPFLQLKPSEGMNRETKFHQTVERFSSMGVQDMMRESTTLLRANSSVLMSIMAAFICPASAIILSHVLVDGLLVNRLSKHFQDVLIAGGLRESSFSTLLCLKLSEALLLYTFCFPVFIMLSMLPKAATTYTVACTYAGKKASIQKFLFVAPNLWKRIFLTYLWTFIVILGSTSLAILLLLLVASILDALELPLNIVFLVQVTVGIAYSVIFAHMMVINNLANVVSVLEDYGGGAALLRSFFLIKGRTQVALVLLLLSVMSMSMVESLFQYRVIGIPENSYKADNASRLWEGPLLVFMYSFLYLFDAIMSSVFYFACKSAYIGNSDKNWMLEQVSIGLDLIN